MQFTSSDLRAIGAARRQWPWRIPRSVARLALALLATLAVLAAGSVVATRLRSLSDDLRYGWPRTTHLRVALGHNEQSGAPSALVAINLDRQVTLIEFPGGDTAQPIVLAGPYLVGAQSDQTPIRMRALDMDRDGALDVVLDIADEWLVYLNKDGALRLPNPAEQRQIAELNGVERMPDGAR